jgi:hypothetical protein
MKKGTGYFFLKMGTLKMGTGPIFLEIRAYPREHHEGKMRGNIFSQ